MLRRLVKFVAAVLLLVSSLVLALPLWLPWVVSGLGPRFGVQVGSYDRQGYSRLQLEDVTVQQGGLFLALDHVSTPVWPLWLLFEKEGDDAGRPEIRLDGWRIELTGSDGEVSPTEGSTAEVLETVHNLIPRLHRFLPEIVALNGRVTLGDRLFLLDRVQWRAPELMATLGPEHGEWQATGLLSVPLLEPWSIKINALPWDAALSATVMIPPDQTRVRFGLEWQDSALSGQVDFGPIGFLPEKVQVQSDRLSVDAGPFGLDGYEPVSGTVTGSWSEDHYTLEVELKASPIDKESDLHPPLVASLRADGNMEAVRLQSFELQAPWASARLSDPLVLAFGPGLLEQRADLDFDVDLEASPWPVGGRLSGAARVQTAVGQWPTASAHLDADDLAWADFQGMTGRAGFRFEYPWVHLDEVTLRLPEEIEVVFKGRADLGAQTVEGTLAGWLETRFLEHILPPEISVGSFSMAGSVDGGWTAPDITLMARAEAVDLPGLEPVMIDLGVTGCGADLDSVTIQVSNGAHLLEIAGGLNLGSVSERLHVRRFRLLDGDVVRLASTAETSFQTDLSAQVRGVLDLQGEGRVFRLMMDARWPEGGSWSLDARNLQSDLLNGFLEKETDWFDLETVQSEGTWKDGPVGFTLVSMGGVGTTAERFTFRVNANGTAEGLEIENLIVSDANGDVLRVEGRAPLVLNPVGEKLVDVGWDRPVELTAQSSPNPEFWNRMAVLAGIDVTAPKLDLRLSGSARNPEGRLHLAASHVAWISKDDSLRIPPITAFDLKAKLHSDRVELEEGRFKVEGESVSVTGILPTGREGWLQQLFGGERPDLKQASLRLRAEDAQVSAFSGFLPTVLAPTGRLDLDLELSPGLNLKGAIVLEDAALRPIRPLGTLQEIEARVEFEGQQIHCREVAAVIGGQRVIVTGDLSWQSDGDMAFEFRVKGKRVPLVREPGLVVRSDLDLKLVGTSERDVLLSGTLGLSDSLFVADLNTLLTGSVDSPTKRPPYFSIEGAPFADWRLDVDLVGKEFMRVETPVFKGLFSSRFKLTGTLKEPKALGEINMDSGSVEFPFASLKVKSGTLSIREENPYDILLDIEAGTRLFGFDVRMLVLDHASAPRLEFESEPNLGSDAVLLMLTTGEIPDRSGYYSMQQRLTKLAVYLGRSLLLEFGLGSGGGENRFIIESGSDISIKGRETYNIEVRLADDWSLVGGYDEFDAYNGGVKWRVYAK